jgi:fructose-1,6-bisphosphatase/inositol monophosphatase family enzyme
MRAAAELARELEGRVANRPKTGEVSSVKAALTLADTAVQEMLLRALHEVSSDLALEAEEDTPGVAAFLGQGDDLVVIDPIDGTLRFFLEALGPYSILLGHAVKDVYQAAHVALPREGIFIDALRGEGARIATADASPAPAQAQADGRRVLISHDLPQASVDALLAAGFSVAPASGGAIAVAPLLAGVCGGLRYMPNGSVSVRGRIGALAAREAGARVCAADGSPFPEDIRAPHSTLLVAADDETLAALQRAAVAAASA